MKRTKYKLFEAKPASNNMFVYKKIAEDEHLANLVLMSQELDYWKIIKVEVSLIDSNVPNVKTILEGDNK